MCSVTDEDERAPGNSYLWEGQIKGSDSVVEVKQDQSELAGDVVDAALDMDRAEPKTLQSFWKTKKSSIHSKVGSVAA